MDRSNSLRTRRSSKDVLRTMLSNRPHLNLSAEIQFDEPVLKAHGGFCDVFQGRWISQGVCIYKVAIKRLRVHIQTDRDFAKQLVKEIRVWSGLYHRNVLPLLGYVIEGEYPSLISEWMENGTVSRYMREHPKTDLLQMILGIARGLEYIHGQGVIHSDIKADNVLVSRFGEPCICDFGISRIIAASQSFGETSAHRVRGTVRWMARELLEDPQAVHSKESDIWAFGMTIYELLTNQVPFHHLSRDVHVMFTILQGYTPPQPGSFSSWPIYWQKLWSVCFVSWNRYPQLRKPMSEIVWYLELLCRYAEEERNSGKSQSSLRAFKSPEILVCRQASVLGEDEDELPTEEPHDSRFFCSSNSRLRSDDARPEGNNILHDHSGQSLVDGHDHFTPPGFHEELRNANTLNSRPNRPRAPSLGKRNIIRDFDLRQSSASYALKVEEPPTEPPFDLIRKWQESLRVKSVTTGSSSSSGARTERLLSPDQYNATHALSRQSLSSSAGSSTIVAPIGNHASTEETDNTSVSRENDETLSPTSVPGQTSSNNSGFSKNMSRTLRRRTGTVSRVNMEDFT